MISCELICEESISHVTLDYTQTVYGWRLFAMQMVFPMEGMDSETGCLLFFSFGRVYNCRTQRLIYFYFGFSPNFITNWLQNDTTNCSLVSLRQTPDVRALFSARSKELVRSDPTGFISLEITSYNVMKGETGVVLPCKENKYRVKPWPSG
jgi:hypothetical protein